MKLPLPEGDIDARLTLPLVEELEAAHGSLYAAAARLLEHNLPLTEVVALLKKIYAHAGAAPADEFLLRQNCAELLAALLVDILGPIERLEALSPGEAIGKTST